jgi:hypothetical protein
VILRPVLLLCLVSVLGLSGCGTLKYERARFDGNRVSNPTLGRGIYYQLPEGYALLNPWSPVPPKPENNQFEGFLRQIVANNDQPPQHGAFREALLFRNDDRYLVISHVSINTRRTFDMLSAAKRANLLLRMASLNYRFFDVPHEDFDYTFRSLSGYTAIMHPAFQIGTISKASEAREKAEDWRGVGFSFVGGVKDVAFVTILARSTDLPLAESDLNALIAGFRYGRPPARP